MTNRPPGRRALVQQLQDLQGSSLHGNPDHFPQPTLTWDELDLIIDALLAPPTESSGFEALRALAAKWRADADRSKLLQGLTCADDLDALLAREAPASDYWDRPENQPTPPLSYRCFHCGEVFIGDAALEHFGTRETAEAVACVIQTTHPLVKRLRARIEKLETAREAPQATDADVKAWLDEAHRSLATLRTRLKREPSFTEFAMAIFVNPELCAYPADAREAPAVSDSLGTRCEMAVGFPDTTVRCDERAIARIGGHDVCHGHFYNLKPEALYLIVKPVSHIIDSCRRAQFPPTNCSGAFPTRKPRGFTSNRGCGRTARSARFVSRASAS
jgi:hypothetical protein